MKLEQSILKDKQPSIDYSGVNEETKVVIEGRLKKAKELLAYLRKNKGVSKIGVGEAIEFKQKYLEFSQSLVDLENYFIFTDTYQILGISYEEKQSFFSEILNGKAAGIGI